MSTQPLPDRRRFHRITFQAPATIEQGEHSWSTEVIDISLKGILTRRPLDWHNSDASTVFVFRLPLNDENEVRIESKLLHQESDRLGFECQKIDLESAILLRRLVELNLGDPDLLDRDFAAMLTPED